ncbi:MAG: hypothetical protein HZR80_12335 [Candidatus Heimdallarchaeota archaeon]
MSKTTSSKTKSKNTAKKAGNKSTGKKPVDKATKKKVAKPKKEKFVPKVTTNDKGEKIVTTKGGRIWTRKENIKFFGIELRRANSSVSRLLLMAQSSKSKQSTVELEMCKEILELLDKAKDIFNGIFA